MPLRQLIIDAYYRGQGISALSAWRGAEERQWSDPAGFETLVGDRLAATLAAAAKGVPYYRELGLTPRIEDFPVLSKDFIFLNRKRLLNPQADARGSFSAGTSGSTGRRTVVIVDRAERVSRLASSWRGDGFGGFKPWSRTVMLWGNTDIIKGSWQALTKPLAARLFNRTVIDCSQLNETHVRGIHARLERISPERIIGYASALAGVAEIAGRLGLGAIQCQKLTPTAEMLTPYYADTISGFFAGPVMQRYGCREAGDIAHQCEHGTWHLNTDHVYCEVLRDDGTIGPAGRGRLLLTKLSNHLMPLVRYDVEDIVELGGPACLCGRSLPVMGSLEGRSLDVLMLPDGTALSSLVASRAARDLPVRQIKFIQEDEVNCRFLIVPFPGFTSQHASRALAWIDQATRGQLNVEMELVDSIDPEPSGKNVQVVNRLLAKRDS